MDPKSRLRLERSRREMDPASMEGSREKEGFREHGGIPRGKGACTVRVAYLGFEPCGRYDELVRAILHGGTQPS